MSDESENPYSRLRALERMGVLRNYTMIREKSIAVIGMGGVGSVAAEMLVRCGIGALALFDYDKVEPANLNRLFYRPEHCGQYKVDAAIQTLHQINPDVSLSSFNYSVTSPCRFSEFTDILSGMDVVLCCVDNYEARIAVNKACNLLDKPWFESGVSENAVSGHIQFMLPGRTACFLCAPPLILDTGVHESSLKREGVCTASLPTTMGLVSALLVQNALKLLLEFGKVSMFVGYNALEDFFPQYPIMPNPLCEDLQCRVLQQKYIGWKQHQPVNEKKDEILHEDNEWGIVLEAAGATEMEKNTSVEVAQEQEEEEDLEDLAKQLKLLNTKHL